MTADSPLLYLLDVLHCVGIINNLNDIKPTERYVHSCYICG